MKFELIPMMKDYHKKKQATHSAIFIDLVYKIDKRYYPGALLDESKYKVKYKIKKNM